MLNQDTHRILAELCCFRVHAVLGLEECWHDNDAVVVVVVFVCLFVRLLFVLFVMAGCFLLLLF